MDRFCRRCKKTATDEGTSKHKIAARRKDDRRMWDCTIASSANFNATRRTQINTCTSANFRNCKTVLSDQRRQQDEVRQNIKAARRKND
ncbi:hypothetical protein AVEN_77305-1 [Araneus ventricosus]|uniref:Uncharacterized protein n=1 Tax=Araneus ventricosus TaxID=182803 RepID=A0A4Y2NNJ7_ARAVE|nr:hypothetical protein AVEN_77305-1 [Araneus ventricosus]